ncbi:MAG: AmmeMemoRadiSam system protein B, partial [Chitinivibrionia bacterium]|nr:AmmeMemoRadiSam system protein B [Chitinivibrionia bacterium]
DEHSLEVQIPFLQRFRPDLAIVPITMMTTRLEACREIGAALAGAVAADLVDYRTSGEVSGDTDQVVGYAGIVIR